MQQSVRARILTSARILWGPGDYDVVDDGREAKLLRDGTVKYRAISFSPERTPLESLELLLRRASERSA